MFPIDTSYLTRACHWVGLLLKEIFRPHLQRRERDDLLQSQKVRATKQAASSTFQFVIIRRYNLITKRQNNSHHQGVKGIILAHVKIIPRACIIYVLRKEKNFLLFFQNNRGVLFKNQLFEYTSVVRCFFFLERSFCTFHHITKKITLPLFLPWRTLD